ncbi:MAG: T9SS type A sorting domain-containing protein, partial [Bacteroidota bacterium]
SVWRSQIQLLLQKQDSLHHLRFGLDGQLLDSRSLYTGIGGSGVGTAAEFLFYEVPALGGNPNLLAQRYDQSHMLDFESNFGGAQNERFLAATANQAGRVWHASLSNSFGTRDLYLISMDSASIYWERPFPLATNQELGGLLGTPNNELFVATITPTGPSPTLALWKLDSLGQVQESLEYDFGTFQDLSFSAMGQALDGEEDTLIWLGGTASQNAQPILWQLWLDREEGEVELGITYPLPSLRGSLQMQVYEDLAYVFHSYENSPQAAFYQFDQQGTLLQHQTYSLASDSLFPQVMIPTPGGDWWLAGTEYINGQARLWTEQISQRGLSACGQTSSPLGLGIPFFPGENSSNLNTPLEVRASTPLSNIPWQTRPLSDSAYCDNSDCVVEAFFQADNIVTCETATIQFSNLSTGASTYEWRANGQLLSTQANWAFSPMQEGLYEISLSALEGNCVDEYQLYVRFEEELMPIIPDTVHCGPSIVLDAGLEAAVYEWRDSTGLLIGTERKQRFASSGDYELIVTDACGVSEDAEFTINLQGGCMWPGDVNTDGEVNTLDFLLLGIANGQSGIARSNPSTAFSAQSANDWGQSFGANNPWAANIDLKHADCDGNGQVELAQDAQVILQNATPPSRLGRDTTDSPIALSIQANQTTVNVGDPISFDLILEDPSGNPIQDVYGVAFSLYYNLPISFAPALQTDNSWMAQGVPQNIEHIQIPYPSQNRFDVAISRGNQLNVSGAGLLARACCISVVIDDIGDYAASSEQVFLSLSLDNALLIKQDGTRIPINSLQAQGAESIQVVIPEQSNSLESTLSSPGFQLFPNPTAGAFYLRFAQRLTEPISIELYNLQGQQVWRSESVRQQQEIELRPPASLSDGAYYLRVRQGRQIYGQRILMLQSQ